MNPVHGEERSSRPAAKPASRPRRRSRDARAPVVALLLAAALLLGGLPRLASPIWPTLQEASALPPEWQVNQLPSFQLMGQETSGWCWAAVLRMALGIKGPSTLPRQCEIVDREISRTNGLGATCCASCDGGACSTTCATRACSLLPGPDACPLLPLDGVTATPSPRPISFGSAAEAPSLVQQIVVKQSPVAVTCKGGPAASVRGTHMLLTVGVGSYAHDGLTDSVVNLADPWPVMTGAVENSALRNGADVYWVTEAEASPTRAYTCKGASLYDFHQ